MDYLPIRKLCTLDRSYPIWHGMNNRSPFLFFVLLLLLLLSCTFGAFGNVKHTMYTLIECFTTLAILSSYHWSHAQVWVQFPNTNSRYRIIKKVLVDEGNDQFAYFPLPFICYHFSELSLWWCSTMYTSLIIISQSIDVVVLYYYYIILDVFYFITQSLQV